MFDTDSGAVETLTSRKVLWHALPSGKFGNYRGSEMLFYAFSWRYFLNRNIDCGKGQNAKNIKGITN